MTSIRLRGPIAGLLLFVGILVPQPALAATTTSFAFASEPGDWVGKGATASFAPPAATFTIGGTAGSITVTIREGSSQNWTVRLGAPVGEQLRPGRYEDTNRSASEGHAALDVYGNGAGCNQTFGSFDLRTIRSNEAGDVVALDLSFEQHCEQTTAPALTGTVRYAAPAGPFTLSANVTSAVADQSILLTAVSDEPGSVTFFDGESELGAVPIDGGIASLSIDTLSQGDHTLIARRSDGEQGEPVTLTVHLGSTSFIGESKAGDPIGKGAVMSASGEPEVYLSGTATSLSATIRPAANVSYHITMAPPQGESFREGTYLNAERTPFRSPGHPGIDIYGEGSGCNTVSGSFVIEKIRFNSSGSIRALDVTFSSHCGSASRPPFDGRLRVNADAPEPTIGEVILDMTTPVTYGDEQRAAFDVRVDSSLGTPTGTVAVMTGTTTLCSAPLVGGSGSCTLAPTQLRAGTYQVYADYAPDNPIFTPGVSDPRPMTISPAWTTTTIDAPSTISFGHEDQEQIVVTASAETAATPQGQMMMWADGHPVCSTPDAAELTCTLEPEELTVGTHWLSAVFYPHSGDFRASVSESWALEVVRGATTLTAHPVGLVPTATGRTVTFVADLTAGTRGLPGQTVTFTVPGSSGIVSGRTCTTTTNDAGRATCSIELDTVVPLTLEGGYDVAFEGTAGYLPSNARGELQP